jgi:hypothetical protein
MSYKERVKITDRPIAPKYKDCFVLKLEGYHGDMDYTVNEEYDFKLQEEDDWQWIVQAYLGYKLLKELGCDNDIELHEAMGLEEDEDGDTYFDFPINPYDPTSGDTLMTVEEVSVVYYNENGQPFEVEIA